MIKAIKIDKSKKLKINQKSKNQRILIYKLKKNKLIKLNYNYNSIIKSKLKKKFNKIHNIVNKNFQQRLTIFGKLNL